MSAIFFGLPASLGIIGMYILMPVLDRAGLPQIWNFLVSVVGMFPLLLGASFIAYRAEGREFSWAGIRERFRLHPLDRHGWKWTIALVFVYSIGQILLMPTSTLLMSALRLPITEALPESLDPRVQRAAIPTEFVGMPLEGNWLVLILVLVILIFNILSEEVWWRGYILPRQELAHKKSAWFVHGILWPLFHVPMWWNLIALLPSTLSLAYVTSRLRNTTPGIIAHFVFNGLNLILITLAILGFGS